MSWPSSGLASRHRERATATVEFALVLPLVLVFTLAILQVGLLVKDQLLVVEAARAGARQASVSTDDGSVDRAAAGAAAGLSSERLDVTTFRGQGESGDEVQVAVTYHARVSVPIVGWLFPSTMDLSSRATMREETA